MKKGICAICLSAGPLTDDHIPPRGVTTPAMREVRTISQHLRLPPAPGRPAQPSTTFKTLCVDCNTRLLGREYDPSLRELCERVGVCLRSQTLGLVLPQAVTLTMRPQRVARAVTGHVLAAERRSRTEHDPVRAPMPDAMRTYFLDPSAPLPQSLEVFFWAYPSTQHVIARGIGLGKLGYEGSLVGDLLKFFPLAFWIVWRRPQRIGLALPRLLPNAASELDEGQPIAVPLDPVPPTTWPEQPAGDQYVLFRDEQTSIVTPRGRVG